VTDRFDCASVRAGAVSIPLGALRSGRKGGRGHGVGDQGGGRGSGGPGRGILGPDGVTESRDSARAGAEGKAKIQRMTSSK